MAVAEALKRRGLSGGRLAWGAFAGLIVVHVVLAILLFDPKPYVGGDNAGYMILAESIRTGQGYTDIHLPNAPRHAQYPPVYPTLLAFAGALGGRLVAFKILSAVFSTASLVLLFALGRVRLGLSGGPALVAAFGLNAVLLYYSHWVMSEALFVLLTLVALWASDRMLQSWRWLATSMAFALLAYLTRAAGLPLLLALLLVLGLKRQWRHLAIAAAATVLVVGGWWVWGRLAAGEGALTYSSNFLLVDPYEPELGIVGPGELLARSVNNIRLYAVVVLPESLGGMAPAGAVILMALLTSLLLIALALVGWVRDVRKLRPLELFTAFYAALIVLWPEAWTDRRFLLPLLPVLLLHGAAGLVWCLSFLRVRRQAWALPLFGAFLAILTVPGHVRTVGYNQRCMSFHRQGDGLACYPAPWRAFAQSALWVRANTPEDAVVVSRKPRLFYYFSGRRGEVYPFTTEDEEMFTFLDDIGAEYVLVAPLSRTTYQYLVPVILSMPERFEIVYEIGEETAPAYVLKYKGAGGPGAGPRGGG
ncbi:MAG: glycosyltransferase family 39 protein [Gemmatimonadota bacterium]|nr:MAG: glycosyltransferase family 39 protein [Gemmatimonadota bacterium]